MAERLTNEEILTWIIGCRDVSQSSKTDRLKLNQQNFDMYHLKHDFSHKKKGQSREMLSKTRMSVEQIKSFFQQALADVGDWWRAEVCYPEAEASLPIKPTEITKVTNYFLERAGYFAHVGNQVQSGLLGALSISKIRPCMEPKPKFVSRKKGRGSKLKRWVEKTDDEVLRLKFDTISQRNYYPDPDGFGLYEIEDMYMDLHEVRRLAEGDDAIYDLTVVNELAAGPSNKMEEWDKSRESGQNPTLGNRPKVKITEFLGDIINVATGKIEYKNVIVTIANDTYMIRKPTLNPYWHQRSNYNTAALLEVANSVWHTALMDAGVAHNRALIELFNLFVDSAMMQVNAISQVRKDWIDNVAKYSDGIPAGTALMANSQCPPGGKVMESLTSVEIPKSAMDIFNVMNQEFNASALTNDLRMGVVPFRQVKATEVVEANQTITSVFQGMAKNYEQKKIQPELELAWMTVAQNWDRISKDELVSLFGQKRGEELSQLAPEDVFAGTVNGIRFRVFGISLTLSKAQDFRKLSTFMQTIGSSEIFMEAFVKKYSFDKFLGEIMTALDIDKHKLEIPEAEQATMQEQPQGPQPPPQGPDQMSQVPQAGAGSLADIFGGPSFPQGSFPGSPATAGQ